VATKTKKKERRLLKKRGNDAGRDAIDPLLPGNHPLPIPFRGGKDGDIYYNIEKRLRRGWSAASTTFPGGKGRGKGNCGP